MHYHTLAKFLVNEIWFASRNLEKTAVSIKIESEKNDFSCELNIF